MLYPWSLVIPLMILLPNLLFFRGQSGEQHVTQAALPVFTAAEGIGRAGVMITPVFVPIRLHSDLENVSLMVMVLSLLVYYLGWVRYFRHGRAYDLLYAPMLGVPVPLAISPILYFGLSSLVLHSIYMLLFSLILAAGHIPGSLREYRRIQHPPEP